MSEKEKAKVKQAVDNIKLQATQSALISDAEAWWLSRRRRTVSQAQRDAAVKEASAGKNLELQAAILSKALEENRPGHSTGNLLAQPEGGAEGPGGTDDGEDGSGDGSGDPFANLDEIVDMFLAAAENCVNEALDAVGMGVGALRDMLGDVFAGVRELVSNILGKVGDMLGGLHALR